MNSLIITLIAWLVSSTIPAEAHPWEGGWQGEAENGYSVMAIVAPGFFSITHFQKEPAAFVSAMGGSWKVTGEGAVEVTYEFHTVDAEKVGTSEEWEWSQVEGALVMNGQNYKREDDGTPGDLHGAWLITGRKRDGEIQSRTPGARKTMKILSGSLFQWIAYNTETGEFRGTGAGHYTTIDGKYTENIEVFSRDASRVGASLEFDYAIKEEAWHHSGLNSRGEPLYEVWEQRVKLGI